MLGDGLTPVNFSDGKKFSIDMSAWILWYTNLAEKAEAQGTRPVDIPTKVQEKVLEDTTKAGMPVEINHTQADQMIHGIIIAYETLKKKQEEERKSVLSTDSTPSI